MSSEGVDLLISILGRTPKANDGYRPTQYEFDDGTPSARTAWFGWVARERLEPARMLVLGTAGSMWDHLFEGEFKFPDHLDEKRLKLIDAVEAQTVTQAQLDALQADLSHVTGCDMILQIIPYCRTEAEQIELLRLIADHVQDDSTVALDITHGFRHLPLLAMFAALHLRQVRRAQISHVWYGSYDPETGKAPVYDLSGLLRIADWLQAFHSFDKDNDYGVFSPMLQSAGMSEQSLESLREASFFERCLNVGDATGKLRTFMPTLDHPAAELSPDARLMLPLVRRRLDWIDLKPQSRKLLQLARLSLNVRDYLRATLYTYEAVQTRICQLGQGNASRFEDREAARKQYESQLNERPEAKRYKLLKNLRNQLAHGNRASTGEVQRILLNEALLASTLEDIIADLEAARFPTLQ